MALNGHEVLQAAMKLLRENKWCDSAGLVTPLRPGVLNLEWYMDGKLYNLRFIEGGPIASRTDS
jgi:hypothetical protein